MTLPPLDAICAFVAVARRMSITLVTKDVYLTQSAVSCQIQSLEAHLGAPLLIRKHRARLALPNSRRRPASSGKPWRISRVRPAIAHAADAICPHAMAARVNIDMAMSVSTV